MLTPVRVPESITTSVYVHVNLYIFVCPLVHTPASVANWKI